jgi:integrase
VATAHRRARKAAGLDQRDEGHGEVLSPHHIRHSWATRLGYSGTTLAQLMAAGGWKTASTATRYMKRKETQAQEAALLLVGK